MRRVLSPLVVLLFASTLTTQAQSRPNFSGTWELAKDRSSQTMKGAVVMSVAGLLGEKFIAAQDAKTLTLTISVAALGRDVRAVYNLDGSESRNLNPRGPGVEDEPIFSRATWEENRLVILTRGTTLINGKPTESKRVIWIDSEGLFNIERSSEGQPTTRSVYRKSTEAGASAPAIISSLPESSDRRVSRAP